MEYFDAEGMTRRPRRRYAGHYEAFGNGMEAFGEGEDGGYYAVKGKKVSPTALRKALSKTIKINSARKAKSFVTNEQLDPVRRSLNEIKAILLAKKGIRAELKQNPSRKAKTKKGTRKLSKYQAFVKKNAKKGYDMKKIGEMWRSK